MAEYRDSYTNTASPLFFAKSSPHQANIKALAQEDPRELLNLLRECVQEGLDNRDYHMIRQATALAKQISDGASIYASDARKCLIDAYRKLGLEDHFDLDQLQKNPEAFRFCNIPAWALTPSSATPDLRT